MLADLKTESRTKRPTLMDTKAVFWSLALLTLMALAMQLGFWHKTFNVTGPFAAETDPPRHSLLLAVPQEIAKAHPRVATKAFRRRLEEMLGMTNRCERCQPISTRCAVASGF